MQKRVKEDGLAVGASRALCAGHELQRLVPVEVWGGQKLLEDGHGTVMGGVDGGYGIEGDIGVVGDGEVREALGVAEFDGYDVLQKFCDGLRSGYVAGHGEEFGMAGEELAPVGGGLFVPGD